MPIAFSTAVVTDGLTAWHAKSNEHLAATFQTSPLFPGYPPEFVGGWGWGREQKLPFGNPEQQSLSQVGVKRQRSLGWSSFVGPIIRRGHAIRSKTRFARVSPDG